MSTNLPPRRTPPPDESVPESADPEKQQYSLDEMMKALREKERQKDEKGEMVTRSDGTLARKVKRRHRRTNQPGKATPEATRKRIMVRVVIASLVILVLLLTGVFLVVHQNSKGYREGLEEKVADWTGAEVTLGGLKRLPWSCSINSARFSWGSDFFVKDLEIRKVTGDVGMASFFGVRPGGLQLGGRSGKMTLQTPMGKWDGIALQDEDEFPFDFSQYYCEALDVNFGDNSPLALFDASVILSYEGLEGYQVALDEGTMKIKGWDAFPVSSGLIRFKDGQMEVRHISLQQKTGDSLIVGSSLDLSGTVPLRPGARAKLEISSKDFPLGVLIGQRLSRFIEGSLIKSEGEVSFTVGTDQIEEIRISFEGKKARMRGLPFLMGLESLFPDQGFDLLEFDEGVSKAPLTGTLRSRPEGIALEDLEFAGRKGQFQMEGGMVIGSDDRLRGEFDVAMNRVYFSGHPKLKNSPLLANSQDGYVRFRFTIGGTLKKPTDTFMQEIGLSTMTNPLGLDRKIEKDIWDDLQKEEE
jgi:hypothetical protein